MTTSQTAMQPTWKNLTLQRWHNGIGLCEESYPQYTQHRTPEDAYNACTAANDLLRLIWKIYNRQDERQWRLELLCSTIAPHIDPHLPEASRLPWQHLNEVARGERPWAELTSISDRLWEGRRAYAAYADAADAAAAYAAAAYAAAAYADDAADAAAAYAAAAYAAAAADAHRQMCDYVRSRVPFAALWARYLEGQDER